MYLIPIRNLVLSQSAVTCTRDRNFDSVQVTLNGSQGKYTPLDIHLREALAENESCSLRARDILMKTLCTTINEKSYHGFDVLTSVYVQERRTSVKRG